MSYSSCSTVCAAGHVFQTYGDATSNAINLKAFLEMHANCQPPAPDNTRAEEQAQWVRDSGWDTFNAKHRPVLTGYKGG